MINDDITVLAKQRKKKALQAFPQMCPEVPPSDPSIRALVGLQDPFEQLKLLQNSTPNEHMKNWQPIQMPGAVNLWPIQTQENIGNSRMEN